MVSGSSRMPARMFVCLFVGDAPPWSCSGQARPARELYSSLDGRTSFRGPSLIPSFVCDRTEFFFGTRIGIVSQGNTHPDPIYDRDVERLPQGSRPQQPPR